MANMMKLVMWERKDMAERSGTKLDHTALEWHTFTYHRRQAHKSANEIKKAFCGGNEV